MFFNTANEPLEITLSFLFYLFGDKTYYLMLSLSKLCLMGIMSVSDTSSTVLLS